MATTRGVFGDPSLPPTPADDADAVRLAVNLIAGVSQATIPAAPGIPDQLAARFEARLHMCVLMAVEAGHPEAREMARIALQTRELPFARP